MSNNLVLKANTDLNKINQNYGDDLYALNIRVKSQKTKRGTSFKKVDVLMYLPVYQDNASGEITTKTFVGEFNRWVGLHFRKDAWKNVAEQCCVKSIEDLQTGTLFVRKKSVKPPKEYYIETLEKPQDDWNEDEQAKFDESGVVPTITKYPSCWIHGDICGFIPYVADDNMFRHHDASGNVTNSTLIEESEDVGFEQNEEEG